LNRNETICMIVRIAITNDSNISGVPLGGWCRERRLSGSTPHSRVQWGTSIPILGINIFDCLTCVSHNSPPLYACTLQFSRRIKCTSWLSRSQRLAYLTGESNALSKWSAVIWVWKTPEPIRNSHSDSWKARIESSCEWVCREQLRTMKCNAEFNHISLVTNRMPKSLEKTLGRLFLIFYSLLAVHGVHYPLSHWITNYVADIDDFHRWWFKRQGIDDRIVPFPERLVTLNINI
jgi:hypothetical protein